MVRKVIPRRTRVRILRRLGWWSASVTRPLSRFGGLSHQIIGDYCKGRGVEVGPGAGPYLSDALQVDRHSSYDGDKVLTDVAADAAALPFRSASMDFLFSAHCLEHQHDVLGALAEWTRVVRPGGHLVLVLPHVDRTFDRGRPVTTLDHHRAEVGDILDPSHPPHWEDFERWSLSSHHDWMDDPAAQSDTGWDREWLATRGMVHYHAWTQAEMAEIVGEVAHVVAVLERMPDRPDSFLVIGRV